MSTIMSAVGEATGLKPDDSVIATGLMVAAKAGAVAYCTALVSATNPEVRHLFSELMQSSITGEERISKLVTARGWDNPQASPQEMLQNTMKLAKPIVG